MWINHQADSYVFLAGANIVFRLPTSNRPNSLLYTRSLPTGAALPSLISSHPRRFTDFTSHLVWGAT